MQLIFQGSTPASIKDVAFVHDDARFLYWIVARSSNHWSNQETMQEYINLLLAP